MLRRLIAAAAAPCLVQPANLYAKPLEPAGKWVVDYRPDQCLASREYGNPEKPITFGIRPAPNGKTYLLILAERHPGPDWGQEEGVTVDFGRGAIKSWLLEFGNRSAKSDIYHVRIPAAEMDQAKVAPSVKLSFSGQPDVELELQSMPALMKTLEDCTSDLKRYWNLGGEKDGRISRPSKGDIRHLFSASDYPADAARRNQSGNTQFMLLIDQSGKVAGCDVVVASGIPVLDIMGCQVIRDRGKFTPALDANGKPVRSTIVTPPITWVMR